MKTLTLLLMSFVNASATTAFQYPVQQGNQNFGGSLGMDFNVLAPITITALGAFDSDADGLKRPINVYLYDRDTQNALVQLTLLTSNSTLIGGARFQAVPLNLLLALTLPVGFHGSIVADGYGDTEPNGNGGPTFNISTLDNGGGLIAFVGASRYGSAGQFPVNVDVGPENRYGAGTFQFVPAQSAEVPEAEMLWPIALALLLLYFQKQSQCRM